MHGAIKKKEKEKNNKSRSKWGRREESKLQLVMLQVGHMVGE